MELVFYSSQLKRRKDHYLRLPTELQARLPRAYVERFDMIRHCGKSNTSFFKDLIAFQYNHFFDFPRVPSKLDGPPIHISQMHRVQAVLHSLNREWSVNGAEERKQCFDPIINQLMTHLPINNNEVYKVLVPGCGLGECLSMYCVDH